MATAALLAQYNMLNTSIDWYTLLSTRANDQLTNFSKLLSQQESYEEKWNDSSCKVYDAWGDSTCITANGSTYYYYGLSSKSQSRETCASLYANLKVPKYDPEKLEEYCDLDMEYDAMTSMYDTLLDELQAQADAVKEQLGTDAADTGLIGS